MLSNITLRCNYLYLAEYYFANEMGITTLKNKLKNIFIMQLQKTSLKMYLENKIINNSCLASLPPATSPTNH